MSKIDVPPSSSVLVACEESQIVTKAFRDLGVTAFSCDIIPTSGDNPEWHFQCDLLDIIEMDWAAIIAFPPCTDISVSGAAWFKAKREDGRQRKAIEFFMRILSAKAKYISVENPVNIISGNYINQHFSDLSAKYNFPIKPAQKIHPYFFGDPYSKLTCLWLKNLPSLTPTDIVSKGEFSEWIDKKSGKIKRQPSWYYSPKGANNKTRGKIRSKTFNGIAKAMASQWSKIIFPDS
jgi:hypothetical protein